MPATFFMSAYDHSASRISQQPCLDLNNQFILSLFLNTLWISILYGSPYGPLLATRVIQCILLTAVQLVCIQAIAKVLARYGKKVSVT